MKRRRRTHTHPYQHDGRNYMFGDSVIILSVRKKNIKGFITEVKSFNSSPSSYRIDNSIFGYHPERVKGYRMVLIEKRKKCYIPNPKLGIV